MSSDIIDKLNTIAEALALRAADHASGMAQDLGYLAELDGLAALQLVGSVQGYNRASETARL